MRIAQCASVNHGKRRAGLTPRYVVLHYTGMVSAQAALERLCDPAAGVSAHYLIGRNGAVTQLVAERQRAWHAGAGEWQGLHDMNSRSIGVELDNDGQTPFAEPLMQALEALLANILARWQIPPAHVIGHSDMAPGRKVDPGPWFDWVRLEALGMAGRRGYDPGPHDPDADTFRKLARQAGYTAPVDDATLLAAVRLRYRSFYQGSLSREDYTPLTHAVTHLGHSLLTGTAPDA